VFGLTPSKYQSGQINRTGAISKCGDEMMRVMLYEAAQIMLVRLAKWSWLKAWAMNMPIPKRSTSLRATSTL
jgi:transposase